MRVVISDPKFVLRLFPACFALDRCEVGISPLQCYDLVEHAIGELAICCQILCFDVDLFRLYLGGLSE